MGIIINFVFPQSSLSEVGIRSCRFDAAAGTGTRVIIYMMASSNRNIFRVTGHLCRKFTGPRYIPRTKTSDAELWCFLWSNQNKRLSKQWWGWWFEMLSCPLWRHRNIYVAQCSPDHKALICKSYNRVKYLVSKERTEAEIMSNFLHLKVVRAQYYGISSAFATWIQNSLGP